MTEETCANCGFSEYQHTLQMEQGFICKKFKAQEKTCANCGKVEWWHPWDECKKFKPKNYSPKASLKSSKDTPSDGHKLKEGDKTLSDKMYITEDGDILMKKDVKNFIKEVNEDFLNDWTNANGKTFTLNEIREKIDKRAGKNLI